MTNKIKLFIMLFFIALGILAPSKIYAETHNGATVNHTYDIYMTYETGSWTYENSNYHYYTLGNYTNFKQDEVHNFNDGNMTLSFTAGSKITLTPKANATSTYTIYAYNSGKTGCHKLTIHMNTNVSVSSVTNSKAYMWSNDSQTATVTGSYDYYYVTLNETAFKNISGTKQTGSTFTIQGLLDGSNSNWTSGGTYYIGITAYREYTKTGTTGTMLTKTVTYSKPHINLINPLVKGVTGVYNGKTVNRPTSNVINVYGGDEFTMKIAESGTIGDTTTNATSLGGITRTYTWTPSGDFTLNGATAPVTGNSVKIKTNSVSQKQTYTLTVKADRKLNSVSRSNTQTVTINVYPKPSIFASIDNTNKYEEIAIPDGLTRMVTILNNNSDTTATDFTEASYAFTGENVNIENAISDNSKVISVDTSAGYTSGTLDISANVTKGLVPVQWGTFTFTDSVKISIFTKLTADKTTINLVGASSDKVTLDDTAGTTYLTKTAIITNTSPDVASAVLKDNILTITRKSIGTTKITVKDGSNASVTITVNCKLAAPKITVSTGKVYSTVNVNKVDSLASGFDIYRSEVQASGYKKIGSETNKTYFIDNSADFGKTYYYKVVNKAGSASSEYSNCVSSKLTVEKPVIKKVKFIKIKKNGKVTKKRRIKVKMKSKIYDGFIVKFPKSVKKISTKKTIKSKKTYKKGKKIKIKVRAYKIRNGKTFYSGWVTKKVKVK